MTDVVLVLATAPSRDVALTLTRTLVEERLAACGNIVPAVTSVYRWEDAVQQDDEVLIVFKTLRNRASRLTERIAALHPYDVPEAIVVPVDAGLDAYLNWVATSTHA